MPRDTKQDNDFIAEYLQYVGVTESPMIYHRWCCLSMLGALLGRQYSYKFGHSNLYTNLYVMLLGSSGARKSTAIKIAKKVIKETGYSCISAERSTKEKFFLDLAGEDTGIVNTDSILDKNLFGEDSSATSEMYIACDEFNDFIGNGNIEFISILGTLWDYEGNYTNRIKNGKSVIIHNPTISILGGNTPVGFNKAFPADTLGQGFFSRLLLIHSNPTNTRITFPESPEPAYTFEIASRLTRIKQKSMGVAVLTSTAEALVDKIYKNWKGVNDIRFQAYNSRRLSHLLKLCLITSAAREGTNISDNDVIYANTLLTHAEYLMPKALGEFGKGKNSDISHRVLSLLEGSNKVLTLKEIWEHVHIDLDGMTDLSKILFGLHGADKIMAVKGGFLAKRKEVLELAADTVNFELLTIEEREMTS